MRLKTFITSYLLFISILFITVTSISVYVTHNQMSLLKERSVREYQTISASLARDLVAMLDRSPEERLSSMTLNSLVTAYANFYRDHYIELALVELPSEHEDLTHIEVTFIQEGGEYFIYVSSLLPIPFDHHRLDAFFDISDNLASIQRIQRILLIFFVIFSIIVAFVLHLILAKIFKPLKVIATTSKKIATGSYHERILIQENNELFAVAQDFNTMAEEIEKQIHVLEQEALGKQQFVDNFAHEIRTPLTSVYGYAEYMQKATLQEDELIEITQYIMDESQHMKKIANSLLELATLRNFNPQKNQVIIPKLLEDIHQSLKQTLDKKNITLIYHTVVHTMDTQEDLLKSLLLNLCFNAIKACHPMNGLIKLEVTQEGEMIIFKVIDNGCGIPKESLEKVTEPFYRVDKVRNREEGNAGLGLTLCQQIAQVFNAKLVIDSEEEVGTQVKVIFTTS